MGATVIDSLLVTLGLDASNLVKNADVANKTQKKIETQAKASTKEIEQIEKRQATERTKRSRELEEHAKVMTRGLHQIRNQALGLVGLFTLGMGIKNFAVDAVNAGASVGRLADNLGMTTEKLSAFQQANQRVGGTAEGINAQLQESQNAVARKKLGQGADEGMQKFFQYNGKEADTLDPLTYLKARANIVAEAYKRNPAEAALKAAQMQINGDSYNLVRQGSRGMMGQVAEREKNARFTRDQAAQAEEAQKQIFDLKRQLELATTQLLLELGPGLIELAKAINGWVGNKDWKEAETRKKLRYNDPKLDSYAASVEQENNLPSGMLKSIKNSGVFRKGSKGVMQQMEGTWQRYGKGDPDDPNASIDAAGRQLKDLLKVYNGNAAAALAEYSGGTTQGKEMLFKGRASDPDVINFLDRVLPEVGKGKAAATANMPAGAAASARASNGGNSTSTTDVKVGQINVQTQATDAPGIAKSIGGAVSQYGFVSQANTGLQ